MITNDRSVAILDAVSPRNSAEAAATTRAAIVAEAVDRASVEGLEGITIGTLATSLRMSKAGVIGRFGSKEALQLAALASAIASFRAEIWDRAASKPEGLKRLRAIARSWISYLERDVFPGGCFLTAAAAEFDGRPGPVQEEIERALTLWHRVLEREAKVALDRAELPQRTDPAQVAFEMNAVVMAVNQARQLRRDPDAARRGRTAMKRILAPASLRLATGLRAQGDQLVRAHPHLRAKAAGDVRMLIPTWLATRLAPARSRPAASGAYVGRRVRTPAVLVAVGSYASRR